MCYGCRAHYEKKNRQLIVRHGLPFIRHVLACYRQQELSAAEAAVHLGLGRSRFYKLYNSNQSTFDRTQNSTFECNTTRTTRVLAFTPVPDKLMVMLTLDHSPVSSDPGILGGAVVFRGTRVPVQTLVDYLADGYSLEQFLEFFPSVERIDAEAFLQLLRDAA